MDVMDVAQLLVVLPHSKKTMGLKVNSLRLTGSQG